MLNEVYDGILFLIYCREDNSSFQSLCIHMYVRLQSIPGTLSAFQPCSVYFFLIFFLYPFLTSSTSSFPSFSSLWLDSADGQPVLLPPEQVQEMNLRSTSTLNAVQRLFSHNLIQTFGCDYSTSGLSLDTLQAKLRSFLELRTADGPRHDNYLIYYSGHTLPTGDWALTGQSYTISNSVYGKYFTDYIPLYSYTTNGLIICFLYY